MSTRAGRIRVLHSIGRAEMAGTQRALVSYLDAANRDRFEHHVLCCSDGALVQRLRRMGIPVTVIPARAHWHPTSLVRLAGILRRGAFNVFHMNPSRAEAVMARMLGVPVVCRRNVGFDGYWARWRQEGAIARLLNAAIDRFIVPAAFLADELASRGVPRERIRLVHNGVSIIPPPRDEVERARREMVNGSAPIIVTAGRLVPLKGHRFLLQAAAALVAAGFDLRVALVGDGPERTELARLAQTLGIAGRVTLPGWKDDIAPYLAAADIYVQPSLSDVLPNAVLEAMALGRCVVASDVGGMRDAIAPGENGALVRAGDAEALAAHIGRLLHDPALRERLGLAARRTIERGFSMAEMARRTEAVYDELLEAMR